VGRADVVAGGAVLVVVAGVAPDEGPPADVVVVGVARADVVVAADEAVVGAGVVVGTRVVAAATVGTGPLTDGAVLPPLEHAARSAPAATSTVSERADRTDEVRIVRASRVRGVNG
jgi:hypothetical protein